MSDIDSTRLAHLLSPTGAIEGLERLSGGASQETWSFDLLEGEVRTPLILRRAAGGRRGPAFGSPAIALATEAELIRRAAMVGVPVPAVRRVLDPSDDLGEGFVMERIAGETIPRKILRDQQFAGARTRLAYRCGEIAARIHSIDLATLPALPDSSAAELVEQFRSVYDAFDSPHPVFELAFRWLADRQADLGSGTTGAQAGQSVLVHGDFRNGNFIVGSDGLRAVLDWELAHLGDPMEDLGWICVNSWRFGEIDLPVGGFGRREDLFAGYQSVSGAPVDPERVKYWEVFGTLKWGIICMVMYGAFRGGLDRSVERAAIGRRATESELDLLNLLKQDAGR